MPVPTDTAWNIRKLNAVFAVTSAALLASAVWLVLADHHRAWRGYQQQANAWETAMTLEAQDRAVTAEYKRQLAQLQEKIQEAEEGLPHEELKQIEKDLRDKEALRGQLQLPAATEKGEIGPLVQQIERATLSEGADSERVRGLKEELAKYRQRYQEKADKLLALGMEIDELTRRQKEVEAALDKAKKDLGDLKKVESGIQEKLDLFNPGGLAKVTKVVRNAPLMDWFNPSEKVQQVVVPDIRTDLNFLTTETIDRCATCHFNIDKPAFERGALIEFLERQVASYQGQDVSRIDKPVVMLDFWKDAAEAAGLVAGVGAAEQAAMERINAGRAEGDGPAVESAEALWAELGAGVSPSKAQNQDAATQEAAAYFAEDLRDLVREAIGAEEFEKLNELYRQVLIGEYNRHRASEGKSALDPSPVLLAHPRMDLYVDVESPHPMKTMGCTSCHEGSGQETQFEHTAHMPREMWVDAETGAPVPAFLLGEASAGGGHGVAVGPASESGGGHGFSLDGARAAYARSAAGGDEVGGEVHGHVGRTHDDVKLTDPKHPEPFAPAREIEAHELAYHHPGDGVGGDETGHEGRRYRAVRQGDYWLKKYGWHAVHYMHWEKPMHAMEYVESSCNKCHTEVFDIKDEAPRLYEGRLLFSQLGCANCHSVDSLKDDLDIKQVGPSLVHVKDKLSGSMMASWIWSPRAFRPTSRMPHYFMLENNSSPVDILRTRTEVAAITRYLMGAEPDAKYYEEKKKSRVPVYEPEPPPEGEGDVKAGRALFNAVGCKACHSNLEEDGQRWIVEDLVKREGVSEGEAGSRYEAMTYNQRHWYVLEHLGEKLERTGPELSGVGTKLKAGRTEEEARAWVYDWVRNPRHYSSYTIMPSFRLSEQEASDMAAYLLSLERPGYQAEDFLALDEAGQKMLAELVATIKAPQSSLELARTEVGGMSQDDQLEFLGKKAIGHYGCNGCHLINGFEAAASACANLDDWGLKDPHKLDFGYFDHTFDEDRAKPITVWKVAHEGLESDAPQTKATSPKVKQREIGWEQMDLERRPWLYHKLHNPRLYDRGRSAYEGRLGEGGRFDETAKVGQPYDKLKMPKFFLTDEQVRSVVTFVTSVRKPLVSESMRASTMTRQRAQLARGRQIATRFNCFGCHNIEGNSPHIWEFFDVHNPDGTVNFENLNNAPPRLVGQGAKTQPQWLNYFLHNVRPLRPWLKVRMPSFPLDEGDAGGLADYFASASGVLADELGGAADVIEAYQKNNSSDEDWFTKPAVAAACRKLEAFVVKMDMARGRDFDPRQASLEDRRAAWNKAYKEATFLRKVNTIQYPFAETPRPDPDVERFARGEALFNELKCTQCHAMGDEQKLLKLWELDNADAEPVAADGGDGDYGYDDGYGDEEEGYGDEGDYGDDGGGYGEEEAQPVPLGPVYSAPNLSLAASRLQWDWVDAWLQEPATIQPGTKMPQWFPEGHSAFKNYPDPVKQQVESMYGYSGEDQRKLLMDFVYASGIRNYTPGAERLGGGEAEKVELKPLAPPPKGTDEAKSTGGEASGAGEATGQPAGGAATPGAGSTTGATSSPAATAKPPVEEPKVSKIDLHDEAKAVFAGQGKGRVVGVVKFDGKAPKRRPIRMNADKYCDSMHRGTKVLDESLVVNEDQSMRGVFVYVKSGLTGKFEPPSEPAELDQVGCMYRPHVLGVMAGQPLKIVNSDSTLHNVKMASGQNGSFNEGMPVKGMELTKKLGKPEMGVMMRCDVHPWMGAVVYVMDHPYFCVSDMEGRFEIKGLPPGKYTLEAVSEDKKIQPVTFEVTVEADASHRSDVTLKME